MARYVARITLEVNGEEITDFSSFSESTVSRHVQVELMNKTGHAEMTPRRQVTVDYVVPRDTAEFDWSSVSDGTLTVEYENGTRKTWGGVYTLDLGDLSYDGTAGATRTVTLGAESYTEE